MREIDFPGLFEVRDLEVRYREAGQPGLGLGAETGRALVANLAARSRRRTRERRDRRRVIVRLDLHQDVHGLVVVTILARIRRRDQPRTAPSLDNGRVIGVCRDDPVGAVLRGRLDHAEQPLVLRLAVDDPAGIENLVPAVLGIGLCEHHQFSVSRVATEIAVTVNEVVDLLVREGQAKVRVRLGQRLGPVIAERHGRQRQWLVNLEQGHGRIGGLDDRLGHSVVQQRSKRTDIFFANLPAQLQGVAHAALYALDIDIAGDRNIRRLTRPWRNCPGPWNNEQFPRALGQGRGFFVREQKARQALLVLGRKRILDSHEVGKAGLDRLDAIVPPLQHLEQLPEAKVRERRLSGQLQHVDATLSVEIRGGCRQAGLTLRKGWKDVAMIPEYQRAARGRGGEVAYRK